MNEPIPQQRFTGIFIPAEILEMEDLSYTDVFLLSIVDSYFCPDHGGCFASNKYLAQKMRNCSAKTIEASLTKMRKLGLIEDVFFDGTKRVIRACIGKSMESSQSTTSSNSTPSNETSRNLVPPYKSRGGGPKILGGGPLEIKGSIYKEYNKDDKKDECKKKGAPKGTPHTPKIKFGEFTELTDSEHKKLQEDLGLERTSYYIQALNNHIGSLGKDKYKSHYFTIRKWAHGDQAKISSRSPNASCSSSSPGLDENKRWAQALKKVSFDDIRYMKVGDHAIEIRNGKELNYVGYAEPAFKNIIANKLKTWGLLPV